MTKVNLWESKMVIVMSWKMHIKLSASMCSCNVSFQSSPGFALLATNRTNLKTVQMGLDVMFHFGLIFIGSLTDLTAIHNPLPMFTYKPGHSFIYFFLQIRKSLAQIQML